ncbi:glycosyltransferase family 39 protein [Desulfogranum marinum]|uniref:glycosyltransferase family 39 protein n=1 Tax=Desulfogranum marinum TaxID=453220 RepID=UPI001963193E|nr:glycosyltransferase family 39 protein [Desulfogranum marinum]MBM9513405.1 glycosyltransferase family 39 protein [Desulfogranum marinum]
MKTTGRNYQVATGIVILAALAIRLFISSQFLLVPDEANYWQWTRYLALGYHDHPPMIAWTIRLATEIFGQTEFAVRLPTVIGCAIFSWYTCLLAARLFSWRCALHTGILLQLILLINGSALIATPDGLLLPCWAAACYHGYRSITDRSAAQWLFTGLWFGLGLLSKYTMVLFPASLLVCILFTREYRTCLRSIWPWIGLVFSLCIFSPVLVWNSQNEWATFRHVLFQGGVDNRELVTLSYLGDFLGSQLLLVTPVCFLLLLHFWIFPASRVKFPGPKVSYLLWMSLPGFVIFLLLSFHVRIYGNWPAPVYTTGIILIAAAYAPWKSRGIKMNAIWKATLGAAALISLPVMIQVVYPLLPLPIDLDRTARETVGWDILGKKVEAAVQQMPTPEATFIFGLRYQYASELAFYTPGQPKTLSINKWARPNVYDFWFHDSMVIGQDAVGIFTYPGMEDRVATLFEHSEPVEEIILTRKSPWFGIQNVQKIYLFRGYGFKGGLRWQPQNNNDIRATLHQTSP